MAKRTKEQRKRDNIKKETARRIAEGDRSSYISKSAKKYGLNIPKTPGKGRYTKSTVNPMDKFEGAKDRVRSNQAYLAQSDRDFKKKMEDFNRKRIIDDSRTGSMDKSDFTGYKDGLFGLRAGNFKDQPQYFTNPETGKTVAINKARQGLTSDEYNEFINKFQGPGTTERKAFQNTFPFSSGQTVRNLAKMAVPSPLRAIAKGISGSDLGKMTSDLGGRKFKNFVSKFGTNTDNKLLELQEDSKKDTNELIDEVENSSKFRNYLSNFPEQQTPEYDVVDDEVITEYNPVIDDARRKAAYVEMKTGVDTSSFSPDNINQLYDREKKNEETMRFEEENLNTPGVIDLQQGNMINISGDQSTDPDIFEEASETEYVDPNDVINQGNINTGFSDIPLVDPSGVYTDGTPYYARDLEKRADGGYLTEDDYTNMSTYEKLARINRDAYG